MTEEKKRKGKKKKGFGPSKAKRREYWKSFWSELEAPLEEQEDRISKAEGRLKRALKDLFPGKTFKKVRPEFLRSEKTKKCLEIDLYCEELKLGLEMHGIQHYNPSKAFHKTREAWLKQVRNDARKLRECRKEGITLVVLPDTVSAWSIRDYLRVHLADFGPTEAEEKEQRGPVGPEEGKDTKEEPKKVKEEEKKSKSAVSKEVAPAPKTEEGVKQKKPVISNKKVTFEEVEKGPKEGVVHLL